MRLSAEFLGCDFLEIKIIIIIIIKKWLGRYNN